MKSLLFVLLSSFAFVLPAAAGGPPPNEEPNLMTEVPQSGPEASSEVTEEGLVVSDVAVFPADPGEEDPEIALTYWEARDHIAQGRWDYAQSLLEEGLERFPASRHLHQQLAELLWFQYNDVSGSAGLLTAAAEHAVRAEELAIAAGRSDPALHELAAKVIGRTGDVETLDRLFADVVVLDPSAESYVSYGDALALAGEARAEAAYRTAVEKGGERSPEIRIRLAEWLLLQGEMKSGLSELNRRPRIDLP